MKFRRPGIVAAASALALVAVLVPAQGADTAPPPTPQYVPNGVLSLSTGAVDRVALDTNLDGTPEKTQALTEGTGCLLKTDESLLAIDGYVGTSTTDVASFLSNSIGVAEKKSGTSCYQVGAPAERLVLKLNPANVKGALGPLLASSAYLDVELKQGAQILATARRGGPTGTVVGRFEMRSGWTIATPQPLPGGVTADTVFNCSTSADSGPDSGIGDNCRWPISSPSWLGPNDDKYFDWIELAAVAGSFALEGGADGAVPGPSPAPPANYPTPTTFFELVSVADGDLACQGSTQTVSATGTKPQVTVRRLDNANPDETCTLVPYTLSNLDASARFLKPLDVQGSAQFVMDMVWTEPISAMPLPVTQVDFESADPRTGIPLGWCPDPIYSAGTLVGIANPLTNPAIPDLDNALAGKQFACVGTQSAQVIDAATDTVTVTEQVYVLGDVYLRK